MTSRILYITNDSKTEEKLDQKVFKNRPQIKIGGGGFLTYKIVT